MSDMQILSRIVIAKPKMAMMAAISTTPRTWRRHQPDLPTLSEAIRRLVELGLDRAE